MARIKANRRPEKGRKPDTRPFAGTCSNCRSKNVQVVKVKSSQVCLDKCLGGVTLQAPEEPGIVQELQQAAGETVPPVSL